MGLPDGGSLPSVFAVSDLAQASVAAAGVALARLVSLDGGAAPTVTVDRDLASAWFAFSIRPEGWELPSAWDPVAGDYATADGWIRLHTNAPHHRDAALGVLDVPAERARGHRRRRRMDRGRSRVRGGRRRRRSGGHAVAHGLGRPSPGRRRGRRTPRGPGADVGGRGPRARTPPAPSGGDPGARPHPGAGRPGGDAAPGRMGSRGAPRRPARLGRARCRARGHPRQAVQPTRPAHRRGTRPVPRPADGRRRARPRIPLRRPRAPRTRCRPTRRRPSGSRRREPRRLRLDGPVGGSPWVRQPRPDELGDRRGGQGGHRRRPSRSPARPGTRPRHRLPAGRLGPDRTGPAPVRRDREPLAGLTGQDGPPARRRRSRTRPRGRRRRSDPAVGGRPGGAHRVGDARRLPAPVVVGGAPLRWDLPAGPLGTSAAVWTSA